jgi:hypothetical protein
MARGTVMLEPVKITEPLLGRICTIALGLQMSPNAPHEQNVRAVSSRKKLR